MSSPQLLVGIGAATFGVTILAYLAAGGVRRTCTTQQYGLPFLVLLVAGGAYGGLLAHELGYVTAATARSIRYADWAVTTPVLVYYLGLLAGVSRGTRAGLVVLDVGMVAAGYAAVRVAGTTRWVAYGVSALLFVSLAAILLRSVSRAAADRFGSRESRSLFESLRDLVVVVFALYPVVWVLGPGLGLVRPDDQVFLFLVVDLCSTVGFAGVVVSRQHALETARRDTTGEVAAGVD